MDTIRTIDATDAEILSLLQSNGRISNAEIARQIEMAPSAVLERIRKLEEHGLIRGYFAQLDAQKLGYGLLAFVLVRTRGGGWDDETGRMLAAVPEIEEVHHIAGEDCFLIKLRTADTAALGALLRDRFQGVVNIQSTRTTIVLDTLKENLMIPMTIPAKEDA
ncbi:MAG: Lrp/AsnC family transcriptional regulator [Planctomycetes bacterium]|nr:Lrp/AsnC family transcriptional regulator [Planctomycetota bacterium]MBI3833545.1 Lrp/AsnC family transcriptional regulator [Planctomycetota bacterium]